MRMGRMSGTWADHGRLIEIQKDFDIYEGFQQFSQRLKGAGGVTHYKERIREGKGKGAPLGNGRHGNSDTQDICTL